MTLKGKPHVDTRHQLLLRPIPHRHQLTRIIMRSIIMDRRIPIVPPVIGSWERATCWDSWGEQGFIIRAWFTKVFNKHCLSKHLIQNPICAVWRLIANWIKRTGFNRETFEQAGWMPSIEADQLVIVFTVVWRARERRLFDRRRWSLMNWIRAAWIKACRMRATWTRAKSKLPIEFAQLNVQRCKQRAS